MLLKCQADLLFLRNFRREPWSSPCVSGFAGRFSREHQISVDIYVNSWDDQRRHIFFIQRQIPVVLEDFLNLRPLSMEKVI